MTLDLLNPKSIGFDTAATWATSVQILVFLGLCVFELGRMYATDRQTDG